MAMIGGGGAYRGGRERKWEEEGKGNCDFDVKQMNIFN